MIRRIRRVRFKIVVRGDSADGGYTWAVWDTKGAHKLADSGQAKDQESAKAQAEKSLTLIVRAHGTNMYWENRYDGVLRPAA